MKESVLIRKPNLKKYIISFATNIRVLKNRSKRMTGKVVVKKKCSRCIND